MKQGAEYKPMHYSTEPGIAFCYRGSPANITSELAEVTCRNCLGALVNLKRKETGPDWKAADRALEAMRLKVAQAITSKFADTDWTADIFLVTGPPRFEIRLYLEAKGRLRGTVGLDISPFPFQEPDIIQIKTPTEAEIDEAATLIGEIASEVGLRPKKEYNSGITPLYYELRPDYGKFKRAKVTST